MILMRYFRKLNPKTVVYLSGGRHVKFDTLDNIHGFYATADGSIIAEFERAQREQRGGIREIDQTEFEREYAQKKRASPGFVPPPRQREQISPPPTPSESVRRPVQDSTARAPLVPGLAISGSDIRKATPNLPPPQVEPPVPADPAPVPEATQNPTPAPEPVKPRTAKVKAVRENAKKTAEAAKKANQEPLMAT